MTQKIAITESVDSCLDELMSITGMSKQAVLEKAVEAFSREQFLKKTNEEFAIIKSNSELWEFEMQERRDRDSTLQDGLEGV